MLNLLFSLNFIFYFAEQHPTNLRNPRRNQQLPAEAEHFSSDESDDGSYVNGTVLIVY